jgi:hypothetical protein
MVFVYIDHHITVTYIVNISNIITANVAVTLFGGDKSRDVTFQRVKR